MLREEIIKKMREQKLTKADVARRLDGIISKSALYDYLGGKSDVLGWSVEEILSALGNWHILWNQQLQRSRAQKLFWERKKKRNEAERIARQKELVERGKLVP